jgi:hypothetical protein
MTSWNVALLATRATDGSPLPGIAIKEATPQARQLATTDETGAATVALDVDPSQRNALYIATTRFSIEYTGQKHIVTVYDHEVYTRITTGLPLVAGSRRWKVAYTITDSSDGSPITGISVIDPLTREVLASNPNITITETPDETVFALGAVSMGDGIVEYLAEVE